MSIVCDTVHYKKYYPAVHELPLIHKNKFTTYDKSIGCSKKMLNSNKKSDLNNYEQLIEQILKINKKLEKIRFE